MAHVSEKYIMQLVKVTDRIPILVVELNEFRTYCIEK